jgi:hypothetical protein
MLLASVNQVSAATYVPIGDTEQLYPFESQPTTHSTDRTIGSPENVYDGNTDSKTGKIDFTTGVFNLTIWERPSDYGREDFEIGWVDFKMRYESKGSEDDEYRILYYVGNTGPVVLKNWTSGADPPAKMVMGTYGLAETWANQSEPGDGVWTWNEIGNITFIFETKEVGDKDPPFLWYTEIYEIWLSVYPAGPPAIEQEPFAVLSAWPPIEPITMYEGFFVDLYVTNITALMGYEVHLYFDSAVLYALEGWTYWPNTDLFYLEFPGDYVGISFSIPTDNPLVDYGLNGTYPIARIYFVPLVEDGFCWLTYKLTKLSAPGGIPIPHMDFHSFYGILPVNTFLTGWVPENSFPWTDPIGTSWEEQYNITGRTWQLLNWSDVDASGDLSATDLINMTDVDTGSFWAFEVQDIWETDDPEMNVFMILTFTEELPPIPEFPWGLMLMIAIAPAIPIVYLWRTRRKGWVKK